MNTTYLLIEVRRLFRDPAGLFFIAGLPGLLYLVFGASQDFADEPMAHGNVGLYIMVGMAAYGAVTATCSIGGMAAVERVQGWGRQLGLTPMPDRGYVAVKAVVAVVVATIPVGVVFALGRLTGAEGTARAWLLSATIVLAGAVTFALFGLAIGLAFRSEAAVNAAGGILVILAFLGNLFTPLDGLLLDLARFTPLYGYATLSRWPVTDGVTGAAPADPLWVPTTNVVAWTVIFAVAAVLLVRRGRARQ